FIQKTEVALQLSYERAVAQVVDVDINTTLVVLNLVGHRATSPVLNERQSATFACDHLSDALSNLLGYFLRQIGAENVDRLVESGREFRPLCFCHVVLPMGSCR